LEQTVEILPSNNFAFETFHINNSTPFSHYKRCLGNKKKTDKPSNSRTILGEEKGDGGGGGAVCGLAEPTNPRKIWGGEKGGGGGGVRLGLAASSSMHTGTYTIVVSNRVFIVLEVISSRQGSDKVHFHKGQTSVHISVMLMEQRDK